MKRSEEVVLRVVEGAEAAEGGEVCSESNSSSTTHVERGRIEGAVFGHESGEGGKTFGGRGEQVLPVSSSVSTFGSEEWPA